MRIEIEKAVFIETDDMEIDELSDVVDKMQITIDIIAQQILNAKVAKHVTGEYADPNWWAKTNEALRITRRNHQKVSRTMGQKRREVGRAKIITFERVFISQAKGLLNDETYLKIIAKTHEYMEEQHGKSAPSEDKKTPVYRLKDYFGGRTQ